MIYYILILLGFLTRFIPHPANFTAVAAVALFSGYYLKNKKVAFFAPMAIMLLSDWIIGFYDWKLLLSVYVSFGIVVLLGIAISKKKWLFALPASIIGTISFFLITNGAVWLFAEWYPHTFAGLITCYAEGLPFLKNSFAGDLTYTLILFSAAELAIFLAKKRSLNGKLLQEGKF
jgi:hypothetical protein